MFFAFLPREPERTSYRMKRIFILLAVIGVTAGARADLVLQQQIVTPDYTGVTTMMVKGAKVRLDLYAGQPRAVSSIMDLNTGETIALMHNQKLFLKTPGTPTKPTKSAGTASKVPVPHAT